MADLSQLSDDQLLAYRDLLKQKQIPPNPSSSIAPVKPPIPQGLQGPAPSRLSQMMTNLPYSAARVATNPALMGGVPISGGSKPATFEDFQANTLPKIQNFLVHPVDTTLDAITNNPAETALGAAQLGRGIANRNFASTPASPEGVIDMSRKAIGGAVDEAFTPVFPRRSFMGRVLPFPVPKSVAGAVEGAAAGRYLPGHHDVAGAVAGASIPPVIGAVRGIKQSLGNMASDVTNPSTLPGAPNAPQGYVAPPEITPQQPLPQSRQITAAPEPIITPPPEPSETPWWMNNRIPNDTSGPIEPTLPVAYPGKVPTAAPETPQVKPPTLAGTQVPETPATRPSAFDTSEKPEPIVETPNPKESNFPENPLGRQQERTEQNLLPPVDKKAKAQAIRDANEINKDKNLIADLKAANISKDEWMQKSPEERASITQGLTHEADVNYPEEHPTRSGQPIYKKGDLKYKTGFNEDPERVKRFLSRWEEETPQMARTEGGKVKLGADVTSLGNILGSSLYSRGATGVITKELMQNSYDAIRGVPGGKVNVRTSDKGKWVEVSDNGKGMTADDLATVFTDLGASGKRNEATASGGFGLAKAAPLMMSDKLELKTVSIDPKTGQKMEHIFNTSKADLLGEGSDVTSRPVPNDTPTGTTIRAYLGEGYQGYQAREFIRNANRSVNAPGEVHAEDESAYSPGHFYESGTKSSELPKAKHLMNTEIPGIAKVDIYAAPPKKLGQGELPTPQGSIDIEVNNHGIFQFDYPIYFGGDAKVAGLPQRIAIDVKSLVPEGSRDYPFSANRETLRDDIKKHVQTLIEDKFIKPAKDQYIKFLADKYDSLPKMQGDIPLYDSGNRLTVKEKFDLMQNSDFLNVASTIKKVANQAIQVAQDSKHMGTIGKSIKNVGVIFAPEVHGVYVPKPGASEKTATIFINPLTFQKESTPYQKASLVWHTIKHEILHDQVSGHYEEFTSGEASLSHAIGEYELEAIQEIKNAYHEPNSNTLRPGIDKALQLYEESRSREALERDIFGGEKLDYGGSKSGLQHEGPNPSRLSGGGIGPVRKP